MHSLDYSDSVPCIPITVSLPLLCSVTSSASPATLLELPVFFKLLYSLLFMFLLEAEMSVQTQVGFINKQKDISPPALCGELERLCLT